MISKFFIYLIKLYQVIISPIIGGNKSCRFSPTCSAYAVDALKKFNIFKALYLIIYRILRCNPFGGSGFDPIPESKKID